MTNAYAVAYFRTSSASNVGENKDSQARQRLAVQSYAEQHGLEIVREFDAVDTRPGFAEMVAYLNSNGCACDFGRECQ